MKTIYNVEPQDDFIVLSNGGFTINPNNLIKMIAYKEQIRNYFERNHEPLKAKCSNLSEQDKANDNRLN